MRSLKLLILVLCSAWASSASPAAAAFPTKVDREFNAYFTRCGPGWNGGDSGYSFRLRGPLAGKVAWLWSDTLLGRVRDDGTPDGRRVVTQVGIPPFIRNSMTLQPMASQPPLDDDPASFTTLFGTEDPSVPAQAPSFPARSFLRDSFAPACEAPSPVFRSFVRQTGVNESRTAFWAGDGVAAADGTLRVLMRKVRPVRGLLAFLDWRSTVVVTFEPTPEGILRVRSIAPAPSSTVRRVRWGAAVMATKRFTYVYGTRSNNSLTRNSLFVARVPEGRLEQRSAWRFWDGRRFGISQLRSRAIGNGVDHEFSVLPAKRGPVLVSADGPASFLRTGTIRRWTAPRPTGPFTRGEALYRMPESRPPLGRAYDAHVHPQFTNRDGWLVSYSVLGGNLVDRVDDYRPRFVRIKGITR